MGTLRITYQADDFPTGRMPRWPYYIDVDWGDVLWAAVTVGRPNRHYVFKHGDASIYEAIFRWSIVRMALEQTSPRAYRLKRTAAAKTLDPTEKGMVNYFLGMTMCKLFASKLLDTPWLLHLDVFRPQLDFDLKGRSRPDLVGKESGTGEWHAFECKGRISQPDKTTKEKAKAQAQRLVKVNDISCSLHIGAITSFNDDALQFYWRDPIPEQGKPIEVPFTGDAWRYYYAPVLELIAGNQDMPTFMQIEAGTFLSIPDLGIEVSLHPLVAVHLFQGHWEEAHETALQNRAALTQAGYQPDGIAVRAGASWQRAFEDLYYSEG